MKVENWLAVRGTVRPAVLCFTRSITNKSHEHIIDTCRLVRLAASFSGRRSNGGSVVAFRVAEVAVVAIVSSSVKWSHQMDAVKLTSKM